jgi:hypothetical protein
MQTRRHTPDRDPDTILATRLIILTVTLTIDIAGVDPELVKWPHGIDALRGLRPSQGCRRRAGRY